MPKLVSPQSHIFPSIGSKIYLHALFGHPFGNGSPCWMLVLFQPSWKFSSKMHCEFWILIGSKHSRHWEKLFMVPTVCTICVNLLNYFIISNMASYPCDYNKLIMKPINTLCYSPSKIGNGDITLHRGLFHLVLYSFFHKVGYVLFDAWPIVPPWHRRYGGFFSSMVGNGSTMFFLRNQ